MTPEQLDQLVKDEVGRKRLAKWMARMCFRENTKLESLHDRINDNEMKELMIDAVNNCYLFLSILSNPKASAALVELMKYSDPQPQWNDPRLPYKLVRSAEQLRDVLEDRQREAA